MVGRHSEVGVGPGQAGRQLCVCVCVCVCVIIIVLGEVLISQLRKLTCVSRGHDGGGHGSLCPGVVVATSVAVPPTASTRTQAQ